MATLALIDASYSACSVSIIQDDQCWSLDDHQAKRQAQKLLPMLDEVLHTSSIERHQLDGIAYGRGPGSFTGIRIAAAAAQGIAMGIGIPVYGFSSLLAVVHQAIDLHQVNGDIAVIMNAHMGELYWCTFRIDGNEVQPLISEQVSTPDVCLQKLSTFKGTVIGDGLLLDNLSDAFTAMGIPTQYAYIQPSTHSMINPIKIAWENAQFSVIDEHLPVYLRDAVAWKKLDEQPSLLKR